MWNLEKWYDEPIYKAEIEIQMLRTNIWTPKEQEINWETGTDMYIYIYTHTTMCKIDNY